MSRVMNEVRFMAAVGAYVTRAERRHWRRTNTLSRAVLDALEPVSLGYSTALGPAALYGVIFEHVLDLQSRWSGSSTPAGRGRAAVASNLELVISGWWPDPGRGIRDSLSAAAFRQAEPLFGGWHDERPCLTPTPHAARVVEATTPDRVS